MAIFSNTKKIREDQWQVAKVLGHAYSAMLFSVLDSATFAIGLMIGGFIFGAESSRTLGIFPITMLIAFLINFPVTYIQIHQRHIDEQSKTENNS